MKLNEICEVYSGYALKSFNDEEDGFPVIKIGNILIDGTLNLDECQYTTDSVNEKYYSNKGDIYIALSGATTGKIGIMDADERYVVNQRVGIVRKKSDKIPQEYIKYFLLRQTDRILQEAAGCAQPNISPKQIAEYSVPEISKDKMFEVCSVLDKTKRIIHMRKTELTALDNLIKARFVEMFGDPKINPFNWNVVNISQIVSGKVSNGFFARRDDYCDDGNVGVLGVANIVNRMYSKIEELPRTNANDEDIKKFEVKYGDMLFCRSSLVAEGIGKASIIPKNIQRNILFECHVIRLPLDLKICIPEFIQTLSTMNFFRNQIITQSKTATMTTIGQDGILKADIILPPIEKQKDFYNFVHQVDKLKLQVQKSLDETQLLFDSLIQQYFG